MVITIRARIGAGTVVVAALEQLQAELDSRPIDVSCDGAAPDAADDLMSSRSSAEASRTSAAADGSTLYPSSARAQVPASPLVALARVPGDAAEMSLSHSFGEAPEAPRVKATLGDALLEMARGALARQVEQRPDAARRHRFRLTAQVDPLSGWARLPDGELLPPATAQQVFAGMPRFSTTGSGSGGPRSRGVARGDGEVVALRPLTAADLTVADLGRTTRQPSLRLRELLGTVDGERCRFPGCTRHRNLHAHHVVYWSAGGPTDLANMVLLCERHHTVVHAQGFGLVLHSDRRLTVTTAEGALVLHHPALPWQAPEHLDRDGAIDAATLPPDHIEARMDLGYVVAVLAQQAA